ncbi:hypothetical protein FM104_07525 [Microbacterium esteraromaticum]|uniref:DUF1990 domain-containing protein n=1 Tax=Microbacterium esteraromaticum TaxID=57043 RepID=A0A1R4JHY4_9MICO|nr:DUF1990 family protein [Microbacterium esteraromaticum]SJN31629.1 hypothetical protein FM104_07525 [Microbacterium esteraromaticum]
MTTPELREWAWNGHGYRLAEKTAVVVHRHGDEVRLTVRSLTRAAPQQPWRAVYPLLRIVQQIVRRRYLRSLD